MLGKLAVFLIVAIGVGTLACTNDSPQPAPASDARSDQRGDVGRRGESGPDARGLGERGPSEAGAADQARADGVCAGADCTAPGPTMACAAGRYPAPLPQADVLHVDAAFRGSPDGSEDKPFPSLSAALIAATRTARTTPTTIAVAAGSYPEALQIDRSLTLRCLCPSKVFLTGPLSISSSAGDIAVTIDGCQIAPAGFDTATPAKWGSCEGDAPRGVQASSGAAHALNLSVRNSIVGGWCAGVSFNADSASSSSLCISHSTLVANHYGLQVFNAPLLALSHGADCEGAQEAVAVLRSRIEHNGYAGILTQQKARGIALLANTIAFSGVVNASVAASPISTGGFGVYLGDTDSAHIHDNRIAHNANVGLGLINSTAPIDTTFSIRGNLLEGNVGAGMALQKLQANKTVLIRDNTVRETRLSADGAQGDGIQISVDQGRSYAVSIENNQIVRNPRHGLFLDGITGALGGNTIEDSGRYGVLVRNAPSLALGANQFKNNAAGDVLRSDTAADQYVVLPVPLP